MHCLCSRKQHSVLHKIPFYRMVLWIDVVNFIGFPVELNAYYNILSALGVGGYRDQGLSQAGVIDYGDLHFTCFQFDYDWRRDIVENAQALDRFIQEKTDYVKTEIKRRYGIDKS